MSEWRLNRPLAGLVIVLIIATQIALPIERLVDSDSRRFGWQMYSSTNPSPDFVVSTPEGEFEIDLADYTAVVRADVAYAQVMPPHLCSVISGAEEVTWDRESFVC